MTLPGRSFPFMTLAVLSLIAFNQHETRAQLTFGTPTIVPEPVDSVQRLGPELSADGLTLYYQHDFYLGNSDIYTATRDSLDSPWNGYQPVSPVVNTGRAEADPAISPDGLELYFDDGHREGYPEPLRPGGMGGPDIWVSYRDEENGSWGEPQNLGAPVNGSSRDYGPNLSADGLELYFSSDRPGGSGMADIWVSRRPTVDDPWGEPENLGSVVNSSSYDERPAISPDGRMLVFGSLRFGGRGIRSDLWLSTRKETDAAWGPPIHLGNEINGEYWTWQPDFAPDGMTLYYARTDDEGGAVSRMWKVPLLPSESISLNGAGGTYHQDFDDALGVDGESTGHPLPVGWVLTDNGVTFESTISKAFPAGTSLGRGTPIFNAGGVGDSDRALALGVTRFTDEGTLQLLADITESSASSFQLQFDVEAWDAARVSSLGEAAFDVSVELDQGDGFTQLVDLGRVTTGATLFPPAQDLLGGNSPANRVSFDSGVVNADMPVGSQLRIRWATAMDAATENWVFGLDNVHLSLFVGDTMTPLLAGDADQDLDFDQVDLVKVQIANKYLTGQPATWGEGDWNGAPGGSPGNPPVGDGLFNQRDIVAAQLGAAYLTGPYAAIQPGGQRGDTQTSVVYDADTGEFSIDAPAGAQLTSIHIDSAVGIFTGETAHNLGGSFDNDADNNIFKATFGSSFGSLSFGKVAEPSLDEQFLLGDLMVVGSLARGGALGDVDLIYVPVPEPATLLLAAIGVFSLLRIGRGTWKSH